MYDLQRYTIIKETRLDDQIGNKVRFGNRLRTMQINTKQVIQLISPEELIAMQRWQGGLYGTTKWSLYIFRTKTFNQGHSSIVGVFPKVELLFFCSGATRVKRTLEMLYRFRDLGIEFSKLNNEYWLHQNARIQTGKPLILPKYA